MGVLDKLIKYEIYDPKISQESKEFVWYKDVYSIEGKYDCVVLMNVLHEIPPDEWTKTFHQIHRLLDTDGYLLFVEEYVLHKGEEANDYGYMILTEKELQILFGDYDLKNISKDDALTTCVPISKLNFFRLSSNSVYNAIVALEQNSLQKLKNFKKKNTKEINKAKAREYAFWTQQYINAKIFNDKVADEQENTTSLTLKFNKDQSIFDDALHDIINNFKSRDTMRKTKDKK